VQRKELQDDPRWGLSVIWIPAQVLWFQQEFFRKYCGFLDESSATLDLYFAQQAEKKVIETIHPFDNLLIRLQKCSAIWGASHGGPVIGGISVEPQIGMVRFLLGSVCKFTGTVSTPALAAGASARPLRWSSRRFLPYRDPQRPTQPPVIDFAYRP
jgi:hypothetical protein